jgi:hypothetical protein
MSKVFTPGETALGPTEYEAGWALQLVMIVLRRDKFLVSVRNATEKNGSFILSPICVFHKSYSLM